MKRLLNWLFPPLPVKHEPGLFDELFERWDREYTVPRGSYRPSAAWTYRD